MRPALARFRTYIRLCCGLLLLCALAFTFGLALPPTASAGTWVPQLSGTFLNLNAVAFADDAKGWAVGQDGIVLYSSNGGATWTLQSSGTTQDLNDIWCDGYGSAWAVGAAGTIVRTSNYGVAWVPQPSGTLYDLYGVAGVNRVVYAVGEAGTIVRINSDWPTTLNVVQSGTTLSLSSVACPFSPYGLVAWAVGDSGTILHTTDGGFTWAAHSSGTTADLNGVACSSPTYVWAVGDGGVILRTTDASTWRQQTAGTAESLKDVASAGASLAWAVGGAGAIRATSDGGITWADETLETTGVYRGVTRNSSSSTGSYVWAVGDAGASVRSPWVALPQPLPPQLSLGGDAQIDEGSYFTRTCTVSDPDSWTSLTVDYGDGSPSIAIGNNGSAFTLGHLYADAGVFVVTVRASDGVATTAAQLTVVVLGVPPRIDSMALAGHPVAAGAQVSARAVFVNGNEFDAHTATCDWGDGHMTTGLVDESRGAGTIQGSHTYSQPGNYLATVTVTDDDGASHSAACTQEVLAKCIEAQEGLAFAYSYSPPDPNAQLTAIRVDYGDGTGWTEATQLAGSWELGHTYSNDGTYTIALEITESDGTVTTESIPAFVENISPSIGELTLPAEWLPPGTSVQAWASFVDPGDLDEYEAIWDWGDGARTNGTIVDSEGSPVAQGSHVYLTSGVYTVQLTVNDGDGGSASATATQYIVVDFDISGGWSIAETGPRWLGDWLPCVTDECVVWSGFRPDLSAGDIFRFDFREGITQRLTDTTHSDEVPACDGDIVTWVRDEAPRQLFLHEVSTGRTRVIYDGQVTVSNKWPSSFIEAGQITWTTYGFFETMLLDTSKDSLKAIADSNSAPDSSISFRPGAAWKDRVAYASTSTPEGSWGRCGDVYLYEGESRRLLRLTDNILQPELQQVSEPRDMTDQLIACTTAQPTPEPTDHYDYEYWQKSVDVYDQRTGDMRRVSLYPAYITFPSTWGDYVVWASGPERTFPVDWNSWDYDPRPATWDVNLEIFLYDARTGVTSKLNGSSMAYAGPVIRDGLIVWSQFDGNDCEIVVYEVATGSQTQITNNDTEDRFASIADGNVVWCGGNDDRYAGDHLYIATLPGDRYPRTAPLVALGEDVQVDEGAPFTRACTITDPDSSDWSVSADYGDGSGWVKLPCADGSFTLEHTYEQDGNYLITVRVVDAEGLATASSVAVVVGNLTPVVGAVVLSDDTIDPGQSIDATATFTDPGVTDTHTAEWDWGDGTITAATIDEAGGSGTVSGTHCYTLPGAHTLRVTVTDDDGASDTASMTLEVGPAPTIGGWSITVTGREWVYGNEPAITYDYAAWSSPNGDDSDIFVHDFDTHETHVLWDNTPDDDLNPSCDGDTLGWTMWEPLGDAVMVFDRPSDTGWLWGDRLNTSYSNVCVKDDHAAWGSYQGNTGTWYEVSTETERVITAEDDLNAFYPWRSIWHDRVAFYGAKYDDGSNLADAYMYYPDEDRLVRLTDNLLRTEMGSFGTAPNDISENLTACYSWEIEGWGPDLYSIDVYDERTQEMDRVSDYVAYVTPPSTWGDYVVWASGPQGVYPEAPLETQCFDIFIYDAQTGTTSRIGGSSINDIGPTIRDGQIIWSTYDGHDTEIVVHDLESGRSSQVTDNEVDDRFASICGNHIVWCEEQGVDSDVWHVSVAEWSDGVPVIVETGSTVDAAVEEVNVVFDTVSESGSLSVVASQLELDPPTGFQLTGSNEVYEITTTAAYTGPITVTLSYDDTGMTVDDESALRLFHYEDSQWVDITTVLDTEANVITGVCSSLSPFAIFAPQPDTAPPVTADDGDGLWHNTDVTVHFTATDDMSGIARTEYSLDDGASWTSGTEVTVTVEGVTTVLYRSIDAVGNVEETNSCTVRIDRTAPAIAVWNPVGGADYVVGQLVLAGYAATDGSSGVTAVLGSMQDGQPVPDGSPVDTAGFGLRTLVVTATDAAGNSTTQSVTYSVSYSCSAIDPINPDGSSVFKWNRPLPLRLKVVDSSGAPVRILAPHIYLSKLSNDVWGSEFEAVAWTSPDEGSTFIYLNDLDGYKYTLDTRTLSTGTWRLRIDLGNGGSTFAVFSLR